ncbi:MAG: DUF3800 domain-containing protein, partial [Burkholderiales bacterium]
MQVYIDESGDVGTSGKPGSSRHFVIAAVVVTDETAADARGTIRALHRKFGWHPRQEFHFNKAADSVRLAFLSAVSSCGFRYWAVVVDKPRLLVRDPAGAQNLYDHAINSLFAELLPRLDNASITIDQSGGRAFRKQMQRLLGGIAAQDSGAR